LFFFDAALNFGGLVVSKYGNKQRDKMKTTNIPNRPTLWKGKLSFLIATIMIVLVVSCNNEDTEPDFSSEDKESAGLETMDDFFFDDADDLVMESLANEEAGGRTSTDDRLSCATISFTGTKESGILKVDFGDGCTGPHGNVRKGVILVQREGVWNEPGTHWTTDFFDYSINGVGIDGTRTVTVVSVSDSAIVHDIVLTDGRIIWPDGRVGTREVKRRRRHERDENHILDRLLIYGTAQGTLCNGRGYYIEILEPLIYDRKCWAEGVIIPVSGKKFIKHGNREITADYGDGTCDNIVTLTNKNGQTVRYEVGK
jgi:hypothetical protein